MKILVLNGSPKGERSNTLQLTTSFLEGLNTNQTNEVEIINISKMKIEHCLGCFVCWTKTPGKCIIKDDMEQLIEKYITSDLIIWSFPLYYYGMPSKTKAFLDRLLPTNLPFMSVNDDQTSGHPPRYDLSHQRYLLISTCGFYAVKHNYEGLVEQFNILYGEKLTKVICSEGELFRVPQLKARTGEYLDYVKTAGIEYAAQGTFSNTTQQNLSQLLYPADIFVEMADAHWHIETPEDITTPQNNAVSNPLPTSDPIQTPTHETSSKKQGPSDIFMKQMALIYNPKAFDGNGNIIVELHFTDLNKTYQLIMNNTGCSLRTSDFLKYNTRIESSFTIWEKISTGELDGTQSLFERKYKVLGDLKVMMKMDEFFGTKKTETPTVKEKKSNLFFLLAPWIALWSMLPINGIWAGIAGLITCSVVQLFGIKYKLTTYDSIGLSAVSILSLISLAVSSTTPLLSGSTTLVVLTYLLFAPFWLSALVLKIPLTAHYSCYSHGGLSAFKNPLFLQTNFILSIMWGVFYIIAGIAAFFLMATPVYRFTGLILAGGPIILGIFTACFAKWYPKYYAKK